ncbi:MAG: mechanosensitive ion channel family protein [Acidobacteriota bacterium]|nr:mechanosensitive ion channel family protein [Acidobacteriota bacterium]
MNVASPEIYRTLAFYLAAVVGALLLSLLVRFLAARFSSGMGRTGRTLLTRLSLPAVFGLGFLALSVFAPVSEKYRNYIDAGVAFFVFFFFIRLFDALLSIWYGRARKAFPMPGVLHNLVLGIMELAVLFIVLKATLKIDLSPILGASAILTMVLGLALQGVLGNILSGASLHFVRSINRGDWVSIGAHEGVVVDTNWRETRILDRASNLIVLPNTVVASERIINYAQPDTRTALFLPFKLSPSAPAGEVLSLLAEAARDCPSVVSDPAPLVYLQSFDEFGVSYLLKFWVTDYAGKHSIITDVGRLAWYKLRRHGIEIAVPAADGLKALSGLADAGAGKAPAAAVVPVQAAKDGAEESFSALMRSSFLRRPKAEGEGDLLVSEDDVRDLAAVVTRAVYAKGEVLFRQGDKGRSAYVVLRGRIRGEIVTQEAGKAYTSSFRVGPGGLFGEMSLFTGMPRTATGVIEDEAILLKIRADDFRPVLAKNPDLAEVIAELVSARNQQNRETLLKIKELSEKDVQAGTNKRTILAYLKRFVGFRREKETEAAETSVLPPED